MASRSLRPGETFLTEPIPNNVMWQATGVLLDQGVTYRFAVVEIPEWRDGRSACDADGHDVWYLKPFGFKRRVPDVNWLALMGSIDQEDVFVIGMRRPLYTATRTGQLICFANDASFAYGNNHGWLKLQITRH